MRSSDLPNIEEEVRRASSPLVSYVDRAASDPVPEADTARSPLHERFPPSFENDAAAMQIQAMVRNLKRLSKAAGNMMDPAFLAAGCRLFLIDGGLSSLVDKMSSTEEAIRVTSTPSVARDATTVLMGLPRDSVLRKLPVALHGPRAFISAALVRSKPSAVLGDDHDTPEGRALKNSSRMLISASRRLVECLNGGGTEGGWLRKFRARLVMVRFARRYHAATFGAWRASDAQRVAAGLIGPYAECFGAGIQAQLTGDIQRKAAAVSRADLIRKKITELIGAKSATSNLQEVEAAVRASFQVMDDDNKAEETQTASSTVAPASLPRSKPLSSGGLKKGFLNLGPSREPSTSKSAQPTRPTQQPETVKPPLPPQSTTPAGAIAAPPKASEGKAPAGETDFSTLGHAELVELENSLVNEQYAHDLIMDAGFQLPELDEPKPFTPPSTGGGQEAERRKSSGGKERVTQQEAYERVQQTLQGMFWQRLVSSLTPTAQNGREDFQVGSIVQARYGGPEGSFYAAEVIAVNDNNTFGIKYCQDGVVEERCQLSQFRLASERVDARPILTLINEVRERLERATPRRPDLHARYREVLDAPWLMQMLTQGSLELASCCRFAHFLLDAVEGLEAPARAERTRHFKASFTAYVLTPMQSGAWAVGSSDKAVVTNGVVTPFVAALPQLFTFLHAALDQLQRDTVNWQLSMIAPSLQGSAGVAYERKRFEEKVDRGLTTLQKTTLWMADAAKSFIEDAPSTNGDDYEARRAALAALTGGPTVSSDGENKRICERCFVHAVVTLLRTDVRLSSDAAARIIPETLVLDAPQLAKTRDTLDRVVLVSTLCVFLRQVLARRRIVPEPSLIQGLQTKLDFLLTQSDTRVPSLQRHVTEAAETAAAAQGLAGLEADEIVNLNNLVTNAATPTNSVFALFTKRAFSLLEKMMLSSPLTDDQRNTAAAAGVSEDKLAAVQLKAGRSLPHAPHSLNAAIVQSGGRPLERALDAEIRATGLTSHRTAILDAGRKMFRLIRHNYSVFGSHYMETCQSKAADLPPKLPL